MSTSTKLQTQGGLTLIDLQSRPSLGFNVANPPLCKEKSSSKQSSQNVTSNGSSSVGKTQQEEIELNKLRQKKAWDLALAPAKQVPMQGFMMWMSGSGVQIFSVMMVYMLIKGAITASISVNQTFKPFESTIPSTPSPSSTKKPLTKSTKPKSLVPQKLTFVACQSLLLILGLWKVNGMGLLPTRSSDWIMYELRPSWALRQPMDSFTVFIP
ncbi:hypothetical protein MJO28_001400 [Puccinia striiformis f. sp. tritici]|uniref:ER membrane protein complex subunit 4 n=4 Tax=Puccinia striiformis TaxID=27350 RepID=A0A0L0VQW1_9BASI|nr:hypothetical protein Pst134EB_004399 [Puccinia striiformis f. sp. tritici]KAI7960911.1 hypothetical protein MJO28_001400 [Puccinia striiformis f. sp. tritici]KNF01661.1 hypothetical protein PSTG_05092 [Puccinia striiformis f. sp. tritici PST-78]POV95767.1 hypothetical protein PSHT_15486 [Puccinia striiformis]POW16332.1 hypothetical protein PSTT_01424 [Puccinia striiformis]